MQGSGHHSQEQERPQSVTVRTLKTQKNIKLSSVISIFDFLLKYEVPKRKFRFLVSLDQECDACLNQKKAVERDMSHERDMDPYWNEMSESQWVSDW